MRNCDMIPNRWLRFAIARRKLRTIYAACMAGRTVYLCTYTCATKLQAKHLPLVRATKLGGLQVRHGAGWVCHDYSAIRAEGVQS